MNTYYLYLIGQANSLVINQMLKFALYMYILDNTGSSVIYSNIIAFSMLPIIFFSPIAGWICDYVKKKKLIVMLDVTSSVLFFIASAIGFTSGNESSMAIVWLCLGSSFLCLGSTHKKKENNTDDK